MGESCAEGHALDFHFQDENEEDTQQDVHNVCEDGYPEGGNGVLVSKQPAGDGVGGQIGGCTPDYC